MMKRTIATLATAAVALAAPASALAHRPSKNALRTEAFQNVTEYAHNIGGVTGNPFLSAYSDARVYHNWGPHGRCALATIPVPGGWVSLETCWNLDTGREKQIVPGPPRQVVFDGNAYALLAGLNR